MTNMIKLSEAIRNGAEGREQCKRVLAILHSGDLLATSEQVSFYGNNAPQDIAACCAIGAAILGGAAIHYSYELNGVLELVLRQNDGQSKTFDEITSWLDEQYPDLMVASWK